MCSSCTHTVCTNAYHPPLERHMHTQTLQSHWFIGSAYTCGLTELLTLLTAAEVKTGFKVPAKRELAAHLRRVGWPEPWHTIRGAYTPDTITHTANGQCNWAEQFYRRCSVLYGKFLMHHFAYINIYLPIVSSPESVLLEPHVQSSSPLFLTRQESQHAGTVIRINFCLFLVLIFHMCSDDITVITTTLIADVRTYSHISKKKSTVREGGAVRWSDRWKKTRANCKITIQKVYRLASCFRIDVTYLQ